MAHAFKTVLIVEDEARDRENLVILLTDAGYRVMTAANGSEAMARIHTGGRPDAIVLDLILPVMDGWTFCERLQADPNTARIPVVVTSGAPEWLQRSGAMVAYVREFIPKPISPRALLEAVARACA